MWLCNALRCPCHVTSPHYPLSDSDSDSDSGPTTMPATTRTSILRLINLSAQHSPCPCHRCSSPNGAVALNQLRQLATPVHAVQKEYAFEVCHNSSQPQLFANSLSQGRCVQPQVRRGCHPRDWHGSQEHESTQGKSHSHPSFPPLHLYPQVGVFTDPIVAKLRPMAVVCSFLRSSRYFDPVILPLGSRVPAIPGRPSLRSVRPSGYRTY